jgi:serine/threonine protein kinase
MHPPLPAGTILQHRYRLLQVLGQGGFGRTYLAEDGNRFHERCVVKELAPIQSDPDLLQKARQLFQREAQILYQVHHPQIPQFREHFEQHFERQHRLFLVQDYVPGKTYRALLEERLCQGQTLSEPEVRHLLTGLLPVLIDLHDRQMIHRDLSPDNIIRREPDQQPVLVDFGTVKQLANSLNALSARAPVPTRIGKPMYAPPEQLLAGRAYPSSDLYALAVTAIVLLTGRFDDLYDAHNQTWRWQQWATVSPELATILNRMLSDRPSDRYSSGREVLALLRASGTPAMPSAPQPATVSQFATQPIAANRPVPAQPFRDLSAWDELVKAGAIVGFRVLRWLARRIVGILLTLGRWSFALTLAMVKLLIRLVPWWLWLAMAIAAGIWGYQYFTGRALLPPIQLPPGQRSLNRV